MPCIQHTVCVSSTEKVFDRGNRYLIVVSTLDNVHFIEKSLGTRCNYWFSPRYAYVLRNINYPHVKGGLRKCNVAGGSHDICLLVGSVKNDHCGVSRLFHGNLNGVKSIRIG